jgi:hypothetical protein
MFNEYLQNSTPIEGWKCSTGIFPVSVRKQLDFYMGKIPVLRFTLSPQVLRRRNLGEYSPSNTTTFLFC